MWLINGLRASITEAFFVGMGLITISVADIIYISEGDITDSNITVEDVVEEVQYVGW